MKVKAILIGAFAGIGVLGTIGGVSAWYFLKKNNTSYSSNNSGLKNVNLNQTKAEIFAKDLNFTIQKHSSVTLATSDSEKQETHYTITILDESSTDKASIYFIVGKNDEGVIKSQTITFTPGTEVKLGLELKEIDGVKEQDRLTIRDLLVWGVNENHFVKTQKNEDGTYSILMPKEEDAKDQDGNDWLYGQNQKINVKATYIKQAIGDETKWEHGAYLGDLNGYVYNLKNNTNWSDVKNSIYRTFINENKESPIDVYIYLQGFTLNIDEKVTDSFIPSGWALHFHNNAEDKATKDNKFGVLTSSTSDSVDIKGTLHLGRSIKFNMISTSEGVRILSDEAVKEWAGAVIYDPSLTLTK